MKSLFVGVFLFVFFSSCTKEYQPREIDTVSIREFKIDSNSIRSIVATIERILLLSILNSLIETVSISLG